MDYIRQFDIRLEKEMYYPGECLMGNVILNTVENFKLKGLSLIIIYPIKPNYSIFTIFFDLFIYPK